MKLGKGQMQMFDGLSDEATIASVTLRTKLIVHPVLLLPGSQGDITVDTDACEKHIGCVLLQNQPDGTERPIK